jgi:hypothetical protein
VRHVVQWQRSTQQQEPQAVTAGEHLMMGQLLWRTAAGPCMTFRAQCPRDTAIKPQLFTDTISSRHVSCAWH